MLGSSERAACAAELTAAELTATERAAAKRATAAGRSTSDCGTACSYGGAARRCGYAKYIGRTQRTHHTGLTRRTVRGNARNTASSSYGGAAPRG